MAMKEIVVKNKYAVEYYCNVTHKSYTCTVFAVDAQTAVNMVRNMQGSEARVTHVALITDVTDWS